MQTKDWELRACAIKTPRGNYSRYKH